MNRRSQRQMQLLDSRTHGASCELYIVEGESAASSVSAICDRRFQAVLPLQGKPLNAYKASADKVETSPLHIQFAKAIGLAKPTEMSENELAHLKFGRIFLLFDPDADGIHIGALVLMYLQRWLPELIRQGNVFLLRVPMYQLMIREQNSGKSEQLKTQFAYLPEQLAQMTQSITEEGGVVVKKDCYQSVGSVPPDVLEKLCVNPSSRQASMVTAEIVEMNIQVFG